MTIKTFLSGGISLLAIGLIASPSFAAEKKKIKTVKDNIECTIIIEDGKTSIEKKVNDKTVKAGKDDKDCNVKHGSMDFDGMTGMTGMTGMKRMKFIMEGGDEDRDHDVRIMRMEGGDLHRMFPGDDSFKGKIKMIISDDNKGPHWTSEGDGKNVFVRKFGGMNSGPGMHFPGIHVGGGNSFKFMMQSGDHDDMDLDKDGTVTEAEARSARDTKLKSYDSNNDGRLSLEEYQALWLAKRRSQMVDAFQALDEDGDAQVTGDEFSASAVRRVKMHEHVKEFMKQRKDGDGKVKVKTRRKKK